MRAHNGLPSMCSAHGEEKRLKGLTGAPKLPIKKMRTGAPELSDAGNGAELPRCRTGGLDRYRGCGSQTSAGERERGNELPQEKEAGGKRRDHAFRAAQK
jgi:hypothetical protein